MELAVTVLQRAYRLRMSIFRMFGNMLFARAASDGGQPQSADYGSIHFPYDVADSPYLVCSDTTSPTLLSNYLCHGPWRLQRPNLLITITGAHNASGATLPRILRAGHRGDHTSRPFGPRCDRSNAQVARETSSSGPRGWPASSRKALWRLRSQPTRLSLPQYAPPWNSFYPHPTGKRQPHILSTPSLVCGLGHRCGRR